MNNPARSEKGALGTLGRWTFVIFMLALTVLFINLGIWQVHRLGEKQALIATVQERAGLPPEPVPSVDQWDMLDPETLNFRPVTAKGTFAPEQSVLIFTSLAEPRGRYGGAGYWIMTPLMLADGGLVWVNRGFVPQDDAESFADGGDTPEGQITIEGMARAPEQVGPFTPEADLDARREWVRTPDRLARFLGATDQRVAPFTIDQAAGAPGALPQGGETVMRFPNRHLEYAGTWFAFALITPIMLGFWFWRQRNKSPQQDPPS